MKDMPFSAMDFSAHLERQCGDMLRGISRVAVAVSGGPDSMALCHMLKRWGEPQVLALHVNHGLRAEAAREARELETRLAGLGIDCKILTWEGEKPDRKIQEAARGARYELMEEYCRKEGITYLFLAHHEDDQAETFLFRLAKGSGLDGLGGMTKVHQYSNDLKLIRPLLDVSKEALVEYCRTHDLPFFEDPSNQNNKFARVRLRRARDILEEEGLSAKRLAVTAKRLTRARLALDMLAANLYQKATLKKDTHSIVLDFEIWCEQPEEISLRALQKAMADLAAVAKSENEYGPRMERVEDLFEDLLLPAPFRKRTLGGIVFERAEQDGGEKIILSAEGR